MGGPSFIVQAENLLCGYQDGCSESSKCQVGLNIAEGQAGTDWRGLQEPLPRELLPTSPEDLEFRH